MRGLITLNLSGNALTSFYGYDYELSPVSASLLATVDISHNRLTIVNYIEATRLPSLRVLRLGSNQLTSMPASTGRSPLLTDLDLSSNRFTTFSGSGWG